MNFIYHLLSAATLMLEVLTLNGRGDWVRVGDPITVGPKVYGNLDWSRTWGGDDGGTISGAAVNVEMSTAKAGTDVGGALPSLYVIIWVWGA